MTAARVRKFTFDTVFDAEGAVVRRDDTYKSSWSRDEVEAIRAEARAEGERSAAAAAEAAAAQAVTQAAQSIAALLGPLAREAASLRRDAAEFGVAAARAAAGRALDRYAAETVQGLFEEIAQHLRDAPSVRVRVAEPLVDAVRPRLEAAAAQAGFAGALTVEAAPDAAPGDCAVDWRDGAVDSSRETVFQRIEEAAARWLSSGADDGQADLFAASDPKES